MTSVLLSHCTATCETNLTFAFFPFSPWQATNKESTFEEKGGGVRGPRVMEHGTQSECKQDKSWPLCADDDWVRKEKRNKKAQLITATQMDLTLPWCHEHLLKICLHLRSDILTVWLTRCRSIIHQLSQLFYLIFGENYFIVQQSSCKGVTIVFIVTVPSLHH